MLFKNNRFIAGVFRSAIPILLPFLALALQLAIWHYIQPFAWFIFYLVLLICTRVGGILTGATSTLLSAILVWFYFIPPEKTFVKLEFKHAALALVFIFTGLLLTVLNRQLRQTKKLQKQTYKDLKRSESQLKRAQQIAQFGSWSWDLKNNKVQLSDEVLRILDLKSKPTEDIIEIFIRLTHAEDIALVRNSLSDAFLKGKPFNITHRIIHSNKTEKVVQSVVEIYRETNGEPNEIIGTIHDITNQKAAEQQLQFLADTSYILSKTLSYEDRLQHITHLSVPYFAEWCSVHVFENEFLKLRSLSKDKTLNLTDLEAILKNKHLLDEDAKHGIGYVAKTGSALLLEELSDDILKNISAEDPDYLNQIKSLKLKSLISVPMIIQGKNLGVITFARCIKANYTEKDLDLANMFADRAAIALNNSKMYYEAKNAVRLREDLLAIVSHDLKNPLGVIEGFNQIISDKFQSLDASEVETEATKAISRSVKQMERLISDLLDFAKIESGTFSIDPKPCTANELIQEGCESIKHHAERKKIKINLEIPEKTQLIECDLGRMKQVFSNLLGNAIKFLPEDGEIKIKSKFNSSTIDFSISDNGPGIASEDMPYLFDRYWQAKETAQLGTGLGLAIVKGIIESHKGQICAESIKGVGTTFYFSLPLEQKKKKFVQSTTTIATN